jgi:hypothetical protein
MNISIYGTDDFGAYCKDNILKNSNKVLNVVSFIGDGKDRTFQGIPVISIDELLKRYKKDIDCVLMAVKNPDEMYTVAQRLYNNDIINTYLIPEYAYKSRLDIVDKDGLFNDNVINMWSLKTILRYLEVHVVDHCNLNCSGCSHFSSLESEESFTSFESFQYDMTRLSQLFRRISKIRLMGGEPLLNPKLFKYIEFTRERFPYSDIRVVTNGLLITKADNNLIKTMRVNNVSFDISFYRPLVGIRKEIEMFLIKHDIRYGFSDEITHFSKFVSLKGSSNPKTVHDFCKIKGCHFLREGRLSQCAFPLIIDKFNNHFNVNLPTSGGYDIHNRGHSSWELVKLMDSPMEFCKYCVESPKASEWKIFNREVNICDWVIDER